jgi:hypothetical protein
MLDRHVVIEFPPLAAARACYQSAEYQAARARREGAAVAHVVIVEGVGLIRRHRSRVHRSLHIRRSMTSRDVEPKSRRIRIPEISNAPATNPQGPRSQPSDPSAK